MRYLYCILFFIVFIDNGWPFPKGADENHNQVFKITSDTPATLSINQIVNESRKVKNDASKQEQKLVSYLLSHPQGKKDTLISNDTLLLINSYSVRKRGDIVAYHPYWAKETKNYNYNLISTLSYYGYSINAETGGYKTLNGWDTSSVVTKALASGCNVDLCVYHKQEESDSLSYFLLSFSTQLKFTQSLCNQIKTRKATGANIIFEEMDSTYRDIFPIFIQLLSSYLKRDNRSLTVTIPASDNSSVFNIKKLDPFVDHFVIDFTKTKVKRAFAPINYIDSVLTKVLNKGVSPAKFIVCLPLYGGQWESNSDKFYDYIKYSKITSEYLDNYDSIHVGKDVRIDFVDDYWDSYTLWFDDAQTLAAKCDLIYSKNIGGVGLWALEYDNYKSDLWNAVVNRTLYSDTCQINVHKSIRTNLFGLWTQVKLELSLYQSLFEHPCNFDTIKRDEMVSDNYIEMVTVIIALILLIVIILYIYINRSLGSDWNYKKLMLGILIFLVILFVVSLFLYFFLSPNFSYFGINSDGSCETSFSTILKVLGTGFIIGIIAMKFLILPLLKPKEIP